MNDKKDEPDSKIIKLGVDIDGTIADFIAMLRPTAAEVLGRDIKSLSDETETWGLVNKKQLAKIYAIAAQRDLWLKMPMIDGASYWLNWLHEKHQINIVLVTARPDPLPKDTWLNKVQKETKIWVDKNNLPVSEIIFADNKVSTNCDIYVDDMPHQIKLFQAAKKPVIIFNQPWNRHINSHNLRAFDWRMVARKVIEIIKKN